ncbi:hypothetical protein RB195_007540 [Necator americanus]|uniref:Uncharacterized protein n=1 Tax=Necator americanus TaxID=51031 RepID=A0ABR1BXR5_NECAM
MRKTIDHCLADIILAPPGRPLTDLEYTYDIVIFAKSSTKFQNAMDHVSKLASTYALLFDVIFVDVHEKFDVMYR